MPTGLRNLLGNRHRPPLRARREYQVLRLLLRLAECDDRERRHRLLLRSLRRGPGDLVMVGASEPAGANDSVGDDSVGASEPAGGSDSVGASEPAGAKGRVRVLGGSAAPRRAALLAAALEPRGGPLSSVTVDRPAWFVLREDPFQPAAGFLRKFSLEWLMILPLDVDPGGSGAFSFLLLGGSDERRRDDPDLQILWLAWRLFRRSSRVRAPEPRLRARDPLWSEESPVALAVVGRDCVLRTNGPARRLLAVNVGVDGAASARWLVGSVRRLEEAGRYREVLPSSQRRRKALELALGPLDPELGGRIVTLRDAAAEDRAAREMATTISTLSHELRTPLTALKNGLDVVLRGDAGAVGADQQRFLGLARRNIERLDRLVGDLLDIGRARAGRWHLQTRRVDIVPILRDCLEVIAPVARHRELALDLTVPETFTASVDPDKLQQILDNVVGNALKFTEAGGLVRVGLQERRSPGDSFAERLAEHFFLPLRVFGLVVEDTGIGMDAALQAEVFEPFRRGETPPLGETPGAGLGLHITRGLVEAHGGRIDLTSRPKLGTTVEVLLPRDRASARVLRGARRLAAAVAAGSRGRSLAALDLRDGDAAGGHGEGAAPIVARFLARLAVAEEAPGVSDLDGAVGAGAVELTAGLYLAWVDLADRLATAWEVELARPDVPPGLDGSRWERLPDAIVAAASPTAPAATVAKPAASEPVLRPLGAGLPAAEDLEPLQVGGGV